RKYDFGTMSIANEKVTAELIWYPVDNKLKLAWLVFIAPNNSDDFWLMKIDAFDQSILGKQNQTAYDNWDHTTTMTAGNYVSERKLQDFAPFKNYIAPPIINGASYKVVKYPSESPSHPGGTPQIHT